MSKKYITPSINVLKKSRKITRFIQKAYVLDFDAVATLLSEVIEASVYIMHTNKKIVGVSLIQTSAPSLLEDMSDHSHCFDSFLQTIKNSTYTLDNIPIEEKLYTVIPIYSGNICFGSLIAVKVVPFTDDDLILAECTATFLGMEFLNAHKKAAEQTSRQCQNIKMALSKLSLSEIKAFSTILDEFKGLESILNTTKIANNAGITRSVVTTALRKLETGQMIKVKPLGPKGTYIHILDPMVLDEMSDIKSRLLSPQ